MTRLAALAKAVAAGALLLGLVIGVPWALWHFVGWPLPHHVPSWGQIKTGLTHEGIGDQTLLKALAVVVWMAWAYLLIVVVTESVAALRGRAAGHVPLAGSLQPTVGRLIAVILLAGLASVPKTTPAQTRSLSATLGPRSVPAAAVLMAADQPILVTATTNGSTPAVATAPVPRTYVVEDGDTLWGIAESQLGDAELWSAIFDLNEGHLQANGLSLTDPHWIYPGWVLELPTEAPAAAAPSAPPVPSPSPTPVATTPSAPILPRSSSGYGSGPPHSKHSPAEPRGNGSRSTVASSAWVELTSGSRLGAAFAGGVLAGLATARLRRRRRYRAGPPRPSRRSDDGAEARVVRDLRSALQSNRTTGEGSDRVVEPVPLTNVPSEDARLAPDRLEVASRGAETVSLTLGDWGGIALGGPGAEGAARAWIAALVTRAGPFGAEVVATDDLADRLLPSIDLPGVTRVYTAEQLVARLESELVGRTRRLADGDASDAAAYRREHPEDPFPILVALTAPITNRDLAVRWQTALRDSRRLAVAALVVSGPSEADRDNHTETSITVGGDGTVLHTSPAELSDRLDGTRLFTLRADEITELLRPVVAVHHDSEPDDHVTAEPPAEPWPDVVPWPDRPSYPSEAENAVALAVEDHQARPIRVQVLGPYRIEAWGEEIASGLRSSAYELLAWFLLHPEGATADAAIDALWPDVPPARGRQRFWTALGNLRSRLREVNRTNFEILAKVGDRYRPQRELLDVDLWRFQSALGEASGTDEASALRQATQAFGGDFVSGAAYLWVEPAREDLHRRALDAHVRLAEVSEDKGEVDLAISMLERAIEIDPIFEDAYRRLMRLYSAAGRTDSAQRIWRLLQGRLVELDLDPEPETVRLSRGITAQPPNKRSRAGASVP